MKTLPAESVHCVCTSPPYWGLRDYGTEGQIGCEKTLDCLGWATGQKCGVCHVCVMVSVFRGVRRVLRKDGTLWLNYGDSYATGGYSPHKTNRNPADFQGNAGWTNREQGGQKTAIDGLKPKDLCMVPARVALALQADGWWLRSEIIWAKGNPMPESVTDRPTSAHEKIYLLSKSERYYYDADAVRESHVDFLRGNNPVELKGFTGKSGGLISGTREAMKGVDTNGAKRVYNPAGRNLRNVWNLNTEPYPAAHFATYPTTIPKRAILAGTSEKGVCPCCGACWRRVVETIIPAGHKPRIDEKLHKCGSGGHRSSVRHYEGWQPSCTCGEEETIPATVLDPFLGSGTTVAVALMLGRRGIGIELNEEYVKLAEERIAPYAAQELLKF